MKSSYIKWLLEQYWRQDEIGFLSRWILEQSDFEPIEFHDVLERIKTHHSSQDSERMRIVAIDTLMEYADILVKSGKSVNLISDEEIDREKLNIAIKQEKYEEAAKLRDKINKNGNQEEQAEPTS